MRMEQSANRLKGSIYWAMRELRGSTFPIFGIYKKWVDISFDPAKNARNVAVHGISLERASDFEWQSALTSEDVRGDYGERRYRALGFIAGRLHVLIYTPREGRTHCISLRKANKRELRHYAQQTQSQATTN